MKMLNYYDIETEGKGNEPLEPTILDDGTGNPIERMVAGEGVLVSETLAYRRELAAGDELVTVNGVTPVDVIEYQQLVDDPEVDLELIRHGDPVRVAIDKRPGEPGYPSLPRRWNGICRSGRS